jgi:hypothetical protein
VSVEVVVDGVANLDKVGNFVVGQVDFREIFDASDGQLKALTLHLR